MSTAAYQKEYRRTHPEYAKRDSKRNALRKRRQRRTPKGG